MITGNTAWKYSFTLLRDTEEIQFTFFKTNDVAHHPVVQRITEAYEEQDVS